jgi:hypothetical protein
MEIYCIPDPLEFLLTPSIVQASIKHLFFVSLPGFHRASMRLQNQAGKMRQPLQATRHHLISRGTPVISVKLHCPLSGSAISTR